VSRDLVRVEALEKRYGPVVALAGVTLSVAPAEFLALLGPSGCGKTTLLRAIAGFIEPDAGAVLIEGQKMAGVPPNRRPVNTVFQNYALFPHLTVAENIGFGPRRHGARRADIPRLVDDALASVGMSGLGERYPSQLSGGQQQRVALARAIVNRPKALLLDEPLGALDLKLRKQMQIELKRLQERLGIAFVYVTHDQEEALVMADRIAVMGEGRIVQSGSGEEIYRAPTTRYVAAFIGEANLLDCVVAEDGKLRLRRGGRPLPYRTEAAPGATATLMVRPEDARLGASPGDVTLGAVVRDTVFVGSAVRVYLETPDGDELVVQPPDGARPRAGEAVAVSWLADRGRVLTQ
jgi:spermidine/putrescine transport system ATP-binding protein